jgi:hypothetical protein
MIADKNIAAHRPSAVEEDEEQQQRKLLAGA